MQMVADPQTFCHFCAARLVHRQIDGRERLFCPECQRPIYENPIPAACTVLMDRVGRILLVKRGVAPKIGMWCLPGGFIETDETPEQAALRELREETGLDGRIRTLVGATTIPSRLHTAILMIGYLVTTYSGRPRPGDDATDVRFFSPDHLPEIPFDSHRSFIRRCLSMSPT